MIPTLLDRFVWTTIAIARRCTSIRNCLCLQIHPHTTCRLYYNINLYSGTILQGTTTISTGICCRSLGLGLGSTSDPCLRMQAASLLCIPGTHKKPSSSSEQRDWDWNWICEWAREADLLPKGFRFGFGFEQGEPCWCWQAYTHHRSQFRRQRPTHAWAMARNRLPSSLPLPLPLSFTVPGRPPASDPGSKLFISWVLLKTEDGSPFVQIVLTFHIIEPKGGYLLMT
jgi:hypothetical protein